ncbi:JAB domain-containing protein [Sphingobium sp. Sx8-8]|uniref:JAB domain-containing protein n=1 Tax=Sphingobium sp. Sx8-8 TaxID=2933617 RepID=UPI001F56D5B6|nr:JAB domain-containing protein [Sphingobium sp. Sx8-8]
MDHVRGRFLQKGQDWGLPPAFRSSILACMNGTASLHLLILDQQWRPLHRLAADQDWRTAVAAMLQWDSRWIAIEQERPDGHLPQWADIRLTRAVSKRLRAMEITLADHVIHSGNARFSFREAGLL